MQTPTIETSRLILRPLVIADAEDIYERWTSDPDVARYMRWSTHQRVADTRAWLKMEVENNQTEQSYSWGFVLKENNYLFGSGGLNYSQKKDCYELGYNIMHQYWNQGYTTEAAKAMIAYAKETLHQKELFACHAIDNQASGAVMLKCGFQYETDGTDTKFDGTTTYQTKEYRLQIII